MRERPFPPCREGGGEAGEAGDDESEAGGAGEVDSEAGETGPISTSPSSFGGLEQIGPDLTEDEEADAISTGWQ